MPLNHVRRMRITTFVGIGLGVACTHEQYM